MTKGYMLTLVQCMGCKQAISVQPPGFAVDEAGIQKLAETVHGSTQIICGTPSLVIMYVNAMVADELITAPLKVENNGSKSQILH